ncbi:MAG: hypothetical protein HY328_15605 [Chloroflexi bacterium]|nr:hypothetical protein [Chloroflexota bacterium]
MQSQIVLKGDLEAQLLAVLTVNERIPSRDRADEVYRAGFRAALLAVAQANSLNIPNLRNAEADAVRCNRTVTVYDGRL